jgi:ABC-type branched-subunit amino acid transport system substrate-binding protein
LQTQPQAKVAVLYQNDELGRSYLKGFMDGLGPENEGMIVKTASYEVSEPTVDSQVISLQASGAGVLLTAATPKFAAQAIRKAADLRWKPTRYISVVSSTTAGVLKPAGLDNSRDLVTAISNKDVTDPQWRDDPDVKAFAAFIEKYMTPADLSNNGAAYGYQSAALLVHVLGKCGGDDLSREHYAEGHQHQGPHADARPSRSGGQHEPDRLPDGPPIPVPAVRRRTLEAVRRPASGLKKRRHAAAIRPCILTARRIIWAGERF